MGKATFTSNLSRALGRNVPFAIATALNAVARNGAAAIRHEMQKDLEIRSAGFTRFFVRGPSPSATRDRLRSRVVVGAPMSAARQDRGSLVLQHDDAGNTGTKRPVSGRRLMVPSREHKTAARPNRLSNAESWRAINKDLNAGRDALSIRRGRLLNMGRRRSTYAIISRRSGRLLVFERRGRGKRNTELLFFSATQVRLRRRLSAQKQVQQVVDRELAKQLRVAAAAALANMRVRGATVGLGAR